MFWVTGIVLVLRWLGSSEATTQFLKIYIMKAVSLFHTMKWILNVNEQDFLEGTVDYFADHFVLVVKIVTCIMCKMVEQLNSEHIGFWNVTFPAESFSLH